MVAFKEKLKDTSLFRTLYIIDLFFCNVSFLQIPAYVFLVPLFLWGVRLVILNQRRYNTFFKLRFGLWIGAFLVVSLVTILFNYSITLFYSLLMLLHVLICFFVFYGAHTEPDFDFRKELYFIAKLIVYITTIANIFGMFCLMFGISFSWEWVKFPIYENRFTGVFVNPNLLGFCSVVAIFCCHMLSKCSFLSNINKPSINRVWLAICIITNVFSLVLCDSNASFVLMIGYAIVYITYIFFAEKPGLTASKVFLKIVSLILIACFIIGSSLMFRSIFKAGFSVVTSKTNAMIDILFDDGEIISEKENNSAKQETSKAVTFDHQNKNIDSGRFKLWKESIDLFKISPIIGISNGNIIFYSGEYLNGTLKFSYHNSDLHNGFLTILVSTGIIGFSLFGVFGFRFAKHAAQHLFLRRDKIFRNDVYPCLFSFLFAYLFYSLFEKALLYDISFMVMWFWLMMGHTSCYIAGFEPMLETQYLFHRDRLTRTLL